MTVKFGFPIITNTVAEDLTQGAAVASLGGTLTGTTDGDLADIAAIALSTSDMYTDAAVNTAVNTAITAANLQIKELQTTVNALLASLRTSNIIDT
jgi:broad specificity polyphosphatase/5'/3'-nucleotidase SurE